MQSVIRLLLCLFACCLAAPSAVAQYGNPYPGPTPNPVPGDIQAENFNQGSLFAAYYASSGKPGDTYRADNADVDLYLISGNNWYVRSSTGAETADRTICDWLNYTISVATAGWYKIDLSARSASPTGRAGYLFTLIDEREVGIAQNIPYSLTTFSTVSATADTAVYLTAGTHTLKLAIWVPYVCIDTITFTAVGAPVTQTPRLVDVGPETIVAHIDVTQAPYFADNTGTSDARTAIQNALNAVYTMGGGVVYLPAGKYRLCSNLWLRGNECLVGHWTKPVNADGTINASALGTGTIIKVDYGAGDENAAPPICIRTGSTHAVRNLTIWYPSQSATNIQAYPWAISADRGAAYCIRNITLLNAYKGIYVQGSASQVGNIYGTCLRQGVLVHDSWEFSSVHNVDLRNGFWENLSSSSFANVPTSTAAKTALYNQTNNNLEGVQIGKVDGQSVFNVSVQDARKGVLTKRQPGDVADTWGVFSKINARIFDYACYAFPNVHPLNTDLASETASTNYTFATVPKPANTTVFINVKNAPYNAVGDGLADDTDEIQAALDAAGGAPNYGGTVYLPHGQYKIGRLSVPSGVELRGSHGSLRGAGLIEFCVLLATADQGTATPETTAAAITLAAGSGIRGLEIIHPNQTSGATTSAFPYAIRGAGTGVWISELSFLNAYNGIDLATNRCDNFVVTDVWFCGMKRAFKIGGGSTGGKIERTYAGMMAWQNSSRQNAPHLYGKDAWVDYFTANATGYEFGNSTDCSSYDMCSLNTYRHLLVDGNCTGAWFWQSMSDYPSDPDMIFKSGNGTINLVGPHGYIWFRPWIKTESAFTGRVNMYDRIVMDHTTHQQSVSFTGTGTVVLMGEKSLTTGQPVTASNGTNAAAAVDRNNFSKWVDTTAGDKWMRVDLGQACEIDRWQVVNAGILEGQAYNTYNAEMQYGNDGTNFTSCDSFTSTVTIVDRHFSPVRARYVKLLVHTGAQPGQANIVRLPEFNVFGLAGWNFRVNAEGWTTSGLTSAVVSDHRYTLTIPNDSGFQNPHPTLSSATLLDVDGSRFNKLKFRMRNKSQANTAALQFITNNSQGWDWGTKYLTVSITPYDLNFRDYTFNLDGNSYWDNPNDRIRQIRIVPGYFGLEGETFEIENIRFEP